MSPPSRSALVLTLALLASCNADPLSPGFAITINLSFDISVDDAALGRVTQLSFEGSGDEAYHRQLPLGRAAARYERIIYRPLAGTRSLIIEVNAQDAEGSTIARGTTPPLTLAPDTTQAIDLLLTADHRMVDGGVDLLPDGGSKPISLIAALPTPTAAGPSAVVSADFNGDTVPDVAVAATTGGVVQVFFAHPDGTLPETPSFSSNAAVAPSALAAGNIAGGPAPDLVVTDSSSGKIIVLTNDGAGNFTPTMFPDTLAGADGVVVADFDKDGTADIAASSSTNASVLVFYGTQTTPLALDFAAPSARIAAPDLDKDGYPDLVVLQPASATTSAVRSRRNTHAVTPRSFATAPTPLSIAGAPQAFAFADLTGDGRPEGVVCSARGNNQGTLLDNNAGVLAASTTSLWIVGDVHQVELRDMDGNGLVDIVLTRGQNQFGDDSSLFILHGQGGLAFQDSLLEQQNSYFFQTGAGGFTIADFDKDGRLDLVVANRASNTLALARGLSTGRLHAAETASYPTASVSTPFLDINGDGKPDIGLPNFEGIEIYLGDGAGTFASTVPIDITGGLAMGAFGDVNGDGFMDLAGAGFDGKLWIALGTGPGTFATPSSSAAGTGASDLALVDIDKDGKLDLLFLDPSTQADTASKNLLFFRGNGSASFTGTPTTYSAPNGKRLYLQDFNADGRTDVLVLTGTSKTVTFLGNAAGAFDPGSIRTLPVAMASQLAIFDANGDGKPDLAVAGDGLQLLFGAGDGSFSDGPVLATGKHYTGVGVGDLDGDQALDLLASSSDTLEVKRKVGASFVPAGAWAAGTGVTTAAVASYPGGGRRADPYVLSGGQLLYLLNDSP